MVTIYSYSTKKQKQISKCDNLTFIIFLQTNNKTIGEKSIWTFPKYVLETLYDFIFYQAKPAACFLYFSTCALHVLIWNTFPLFIHFTEVFWSSFTNTFFFQQLTNIFYWFHVWRLSWSFHYPNAVFEHCAC